MSTVPESGGLSQIGRVGVLDVWGREISLKHDGVADGEDILDKLEGLGRMV